MTSSREGTTPSLVGRSISAGVMNFGRAAIWDNRQPVTEENSCDAWAKAKARERADWVTALEEALEVVPGPRLAASLQRVAEALPLVASVEVVAIRIRDRERGELHLLAAVGLSAEGNRYALTPQTLPRTRTILALGANHSVARVLGLRWLHGAWLENDEGTVGTVTVGSRTERRPDEEELRLIDAVAERMSLKLEGADRTEEALQRAAVELVQHPPGIPDEPFDTGPLDVLRPRERSILELYADGLGTGDVANLLVISPHTVRTHVKNALQRLGMHSRDDAEELVRSERAQALL